MSEPNTEQADIIATLAAHDGRAQNLDGDWLCVCGAFLCASKDQRLERSHRQHIATILIRTRPGARP